MPRNCLDCGKPYGGRSICKCRVYTNILAENREKLVMELLKISHLPKDELDLLYEDLIYDELLPG